MMVAMTLMHRYHVGIHWGANSDPLKPLLGVFKIDVKDIARAIQGRSRGPRFHQLNRCLASAKAKHQRKRLQLNALDNVWSRQFDPDQLHHG